jgi:hypothetical protein
VLLDKQFLAEKKNNKVNGLLHSVFSYFCSFLVFVFLSISSAEESLDDTDVLSDVFDSLSSSDLPNEDLIAMNYAVLQFVDKYTGKFSTLIVQAGDSIQHHSLQIHLSKCYSSGPFDPPDAKAQITIHDMDISEQALPVFENWMIASVPSMATLEHRRYGLWLKKCVNSPEKLDNLDP